MLKAVPKPQTAKKRGSRKFMLAVLFLLALIAFSFASLDSKIRPVALTIAEYQSRNRCVEAMRLAVLDSLQEMPATYDELYTIEKDVKGNITSILCNTRNMNELQNRLEVAADLALAEIAEKPAQIPLGTLTGVQLLSARGPLIEVESLPLSAVESRVDSSFVSAGINQTKLDVNLVFSVDVQVLFAGVSEHTVFESSVPVAQVILVGETPEFYAGNAEFSAKM